MVQLGWIRRRRFSAAPRLTVVSASFVIVLAGCGSASASTSTAPATSSRSSPTAAAPSPTPTPQSMDDFVSQANMLCATAGAAGAAVPKPSTSNGSVTNPAASDLPVIATYFASLITFEQQLDSQLQGLGTPPSMQSVWTQSLGAYETIVSDFQAAQSAAQSGDLSAYETAITQETTDNNLVVQDFNEFGATVCAGGSSSSPSPSASASPSPT